MFWLGAWEKVEAFPPPPKKKVILESNESHGDDCQFLESVEKNNINKNQIQNPYNL